MLEIDLEHCAALLRSVATEIATNGPRQASDVSLVDLIGHAKARSADAEKAVRDALKMRYPHIGWVGEEALPEAGDYWLYDPIDGAYHYLQGLPLWSSSLVLVQNNQPTLSVVYDPTRDELFAARKGQGSTCNGRRVSVSPKSAIGAAVVGTAVPPLAQVGEAEQRDALDLLGVIAKSVFAVRPIAAASLQLAYVGAGRLDAYWETGTDAADWLAGALLVSEAGGTVTDLRGRAFDRSGSGILAGSAAMHSALLSMTSQA